jgi:predicted ferric reductase
MPDQRHSSWTALRNLVRFLLVYGLALAALFWLLPAAALFLQGLYDGLDAVARIALIASLVVVAVAWQANVFRFRLRRSRLVLRDPAETAGTSQPPR